MKRDEIINGKAFIKPQISIQECKAIVNKNGQKYTDEEIMEIRSNLLVLVEIDYHHFFKCMRSEYEKLNEQNEEPETEVKIVTMKRNENEDNSEHFRMAS
jgi:hypothetical protein